MRYSIRKYLFLFLILSSSWGFANEATTISCGQSSSTVFNSDSSESPFFVLKINTSTGPKFYPYLMDKEYLRIRCEVDRVGKPIILVSHICGGSACIEDGYSIIDAQTGQMLLGTEREGNQANEKKAVKLLGHPVRRFRCIGSSKTSASIPNNDGEYCYVSPLSLG